MRRGCVSNKVHERDYLVDPVLFRYKLFFVSNGYLIGMVLYVCIWFIGVCTIVFHETIDRWYTRGEKSIILLQYTLLVPSLATLIYTNIVRARRVNVQMNATVNCTYGFSS